MVTTSKPRVPFPYLILRVAGFDSASGPIPVNRKHCQRVVDFENIFSLSADLYRRSMLYTSAAQHEIVPTTTLRSTCLLVLPYTTNSGSPEGARSPLLVSGTHSRACVG